MRQTEFLFNIPAEHHVLGRTDEFITVKAKELFANVVKVDIVEMPAILLTRIKNPETLYMLIQRSADVKIKTALDVADINYNYCV